MQPFAYLPINTWQLEGLADYMDEPRMTLTCYRDNFGYGWKHVDLFVHDASGHELNWVHWGVAEDGPEAADQVTAIVEPTLRRTSSWRHSTSPSGMDYWEADARWEASAEPN